MSTGRILVHRDEGSHVAVVTIDNPERKNAYDPPMRNQLYEHLQDLAYDDDVKVVLLRGEGGVFSTGADMNNAYAWYDGRPGKSEAVTAEAAQAAAAVTAMAETNGEATPVKKRRRGPTQRRRLAVDRQIFDLYRFWQGYPKVTVVEVSGFALGGGFELALMADIAVVADDTVLGSPATRFLGPALGSIHMFFHRLGPVWARRLLLTGDTIKASELATANVFTEIVDPAIVTDRAAWWAEKASRMPADGIVMAKEAFRLVEQLQAYQGDEVLNYMIHSYGTNLTFEDDEFNFVKTRKDHGTKKAFERRDEHFEVPWVE